MRRSCLIPLKGWRKTARYALIRSIPAQHHFAGAQVTYLTNTSSHGGGDVTAPSLAASDATALLRGATRHNFGRGVRSEHGWDERFVAKHATLNSRDEVSVEHEHRALTVSSSGQHLMSLAAYWSVNVLSRGW